MARRGHESPRQRVKTVARNTLSLCGKLRSFPGDMMKDSVQQDEVIFESYAQKIFNFSKSLSFAFSSCRVFVDFPLRILMKCFDKLIRCKSKCVRHAFGTKMDGRRKLRKKSSFVTQQVGTKRNRDHQRG